MMLRRASLLVAFCLLTSAATAFAECAWVLWERVVTTGESADYIMLSAHSAEAQCQAEMPSRVRLVAVYLKGEGYRIEGQDREGVIAFHDTRKVSHVRKLECWPDTVDPRGPKGK